MKVRMIAPNTDVTNNVIDACLALGLMNIELYLAKQFECVSSSTGSPIGDCISLNNSPLKRATTQSPKDCGISFTLPQYPTLADRFSPTGERWPSL